MMLCQMKLVNHKHVKLHGHMTQHDSCMILLRSIDVMSGYMTSLSNKTPLQFRIYPSDIFWYDSDEVEGHIQSIYVCTFFLNLYYATTLIFFYFEFVIFTTYTIMLPNSLIQLYLNTEVRKKSKKVLLKIIFQCRIRYQSFSIYFQLYVFSLNFFALLSSLETI